MFETTFITLFPEAFPGPLGVSILERARREGIWDWETIQLREFDRPASVWAREC